MPTVLVRITICWLGKHRSRANSNSPAMVTRCSRRDKLVVHPYTVRSDKLPEYTTDVNQLYDALYNKAGVNGLFTDFPDKAVKFLNKE